MNNYFPSGYIDRWFPERYFLISIIAPSSETVKGAGGGGGSYLQPGESLFPDEILQQFKIPEKELEKKLPEVLKEIENYLDTDEEEAIVLIQIISELPHHFIEQRKFDLKSKAEIINVIDYIAKESSVINNKKRIKKRERK